MNLTTNLWTEILNIRNQLRDTTDRFCDVSSDISDDSIDTMAQVSLLGASGTQYLISKDGEHTSIVASVIEKVDGVSTRVVTDNLNNLDLDLCSDEVSSDLNVSARVSDILNDISSGAAINEAMTNVSSGFLSNVNVPLTDISERLKNTPNLSVSDSRDLYEYFSNAATDGKVSQYSFLSILQQITKVGKETVDDDGTTVMDTSKAFVLQSFISTVFAIVETVASAILNVLSIAFGAIFYAISGIFNLISNLFKNYVDSTVSVDYDQTIPYVRGPVNYSIIDNGIITSDQNKFNYDTLNSGILKKDFGLFDTYIWGDDSNISVAKYNVNSFLKLGLNMDALFLDLFVRMGNTKTSAVNYRSSAELTNNHIYGIQCAPVTTWDLISKAIPDNALTIEQLYDLIGNPSKVTKYLAMQAIVIAGSVVRMNATLDFTHCLVNKVNNVYTFAGWNSIISSLNSDYKGFRYVSSMIIATYCFCKRHLDINIFDSMSSNDAVEILQLFYKHVINNSASVNNVNSYGTVIDSGSVDHLSTIYDLNDPTSISYTYNVYYSTNPILEIMLPFQSYGIDYDAYDERVSTVPVQRMITIPDISSSQFWAAFAVVLTAAVAIGVAAGVGKMKFKKWRTKWEMNKAKEISKLKSDYQKAPTTENFNSFYKATRSYNRKAKFLGARTYDSSNLWFNDAQSMTSISPANFADSVSAPYIYKAITGSMPS